MCLRWFQLATERMKAELERLKQDHELEMLETRHNAGETGFVTVCCMYYM